MFRCAAVSLSRDIMHCTAKTPRRGRKPGADARIKDSGRALQCAHSLIVLTPQCDITGSEGPYRQGDNLMPSAVAWRPYVLPLGTVSPCCLLRALLRLQAAASQPLGAYQRAHQSSPTHQPVHVSARAAQQ